MEQLENTNIEAVEEIKSDEPTILSVEVLTPVEEIPSVEDRTIVLEPAKTILQTEDIPGRGVVEFLVISEAQVVPPPTQTKYIKEQFEHFKADAEARIESAQECITDAEAEIAMWEDHISKFN